MIQQFFSFVQQSFIKRNYRFSNYSPSLNRTVTFEVFLPLRYRTFKNYPLIIFNDGQDFEAMGMKNTLRKMYQTHQIQDCIIVGVHCNENRLYEYGTMEANHYEGYGNKSIQYNQFIINELLPFLENKYKIKKEQRIIAGFSLGALSALDIAWNNAEVFSKVGVFSGALWWRSQPFDENNPDANRIMIDTISQSSKRENLQFWFQVGTKDEDSDRNHNGIIDAIDDTKDTMDTLLSIGYPPEAIYYEEIEGGEHNPYTWGQAMPLFLRWAVGQ